MHSIKNLRRRTLARTTGGLAALAMAGATAVATTSAGIGPMRLHLGRRREPNTR
jgi:hypothetical protein